MKNCEGCEVLDCVVLVCVVVVPCDVLEGKLVCEILGNVVVCGVCGVCVVVSVVLVCVVVVVSDVEVTGECEGESWKDPLGEADGAIKVESFLKESMCAARDVIIWWKDILWVGSRNQHLRPKSFKKLGVCRGRTGVIKSCPIATVMSLIDLPL